MVGPRRRVVVRGGRLRIVLVLSSSYLLRAGGRGHISVVVREREMAMARVSHQRRRHPREGVGEGQHVGGGLAHRCCC